MRPKYVFHNIEKDARVVILPPNIEEVLNENFNYKDYIEKYLKENNWQEDLEAQIFKEENTKKEDLDTITDSLLKEDLLEAYQNEIIEIQNKYEEDLINKVQTLDYNKAMKEVARKYYLKLIEIKTQRKEREEALKRLEDLSNGVITPAEIHLKDLIDYRDEEVYKQNKILFQSIFDKIIRALDKEPEDTDITLEQILLDYKKRRRK